MPEIGDTALVLSVKSALVKSTIVLFPRGVYYAERRTPTRGKSTIVLFTRAPLTDKTTASVYVPGFCH